MNVDFFKGYLLCFLLFAGGLFAFPLLFGGCRTAGLQAADAELVAGHSRNIGRIEGAADALADTIADSRERLEIVARAGERIGDGIDRLEYLFGEYEREVGRLLDEIDNLRKQIEVLEAGGGGGVGSPALPYSGVHSEETGLHSEVLIDGIMAYGYTSGFV